MPKEVVLPKFDKLMTDGVIQAWLKKPGEAVEKGEAISIIETSKVTVELEAPSSGILIPLSPEGSTPKVGEVVALILAPGEERPDLKPQTPPKLESHISVPAKDIENEKGVPIPATPAARKLARELGVNLTEITPQGTAGRIIAEDVAAYAKIEKHPEASPVAQREIPRELDETITLTGWRKVMAERMAQSIVTAARVTTVAEVDATELVALRGKLGALEKDIGLKITYTPFIVKAVAKALSEFPIMNSTLIRDTITIHRNIDIGVAVALERGGLVVPVIRDSNNKDLLKVAKELEELSRRAHENRLTLQDVTEGTFTITNPGMMGVILDTPIINIPQCAILGVGAIVKRPSVINDQVAIRQIMLLSLSYDHRITEGLPAIRFLQRVKQLLESPYLFLVDRII